MNDIIEAGLTLTFERLLMQKCREDGEFVFADAAGKPYTIKAREFAKQKGINWE